MAGNRSIDVVDGVATVDELGHRWAIALINRHPDKHVDCTVRLGDTVLNGPVDATILHGDSPDAFNDVKNPDRVVPTEKRLTLDGNALRLPPHSLVIVRVPAHADSPSPTQAEGERPLVVVNYFAGWWKKLPNKWHGRGWNDQEPDWRRTIRTASRFLASTTTRPPWIARLRRRPTTESMLSPYSGISQNPGVARKVRASAEQGSRDLSGVGQCGDDAFLHRVLQLPGLLRERRRGMGRLRGDVGRRNETPGLSPRRWTLGFQGSRCHPVPAG